VEGPEKISTRTFSTVRDFSFGASRAATAYERLLLSAEVDSNQFDKVWCPVSRTSCRRDLDRYEPRPKFLLILSICQKRPVSQCSMLESNVDWWSKVRPSEFASEPSVARSKKGFDCRCHGVGVIHEVENAPFVERRAGMRRAEGNQVADPIVALAREFQMRMLVVDRDDLAA
jgi:hypothetical protein